MNFENYTKSIVSKVRFYIDNKFEKLEKTLDQAIKSIPTPENGKDGKSVTLEDVRPMVEELVKSIEVPTPDITHLEERVDQAIKSIPTPENGKDGKSVTLEDVRPMVEELVKSIEVPTPDITHLEERVDQAIKSIPTPENGKDGKSVTLEDVRPMVEELVKSIEVPTPDITHLEERVDQAIKSIPTPKDGIDALDIEVLPEVNFSKSYPAGVYAYHNGGLWRTVNRTKEKAGWECIVDGISDVNFEFDGGRKFSLSIKKSSGDVITKEFKIPSMIDKGVFKDTEDYETGDTVTYGGSMWIAQKDSPEGKPGVSKDWRLSVKKGRDGRETVKIEGK